MAGRQASAVVDGGIRGHLRPGGDAPAVCRPHGGFRWWSALGYSAGADQHGAGGHARMHAAMSGGEVAAGSVGAAGGSSSLMSAGHGEMPGVPGHCPGCAGDGVMISCLAIVVLLVIAALIGPFGRRSWWLAVDLLDVGAARVRAAAVRERPPLTLMELSISRT